MELKYRPKIIFLSFSLLIITTIIIPKTKSDDDNSNDENLRVMLSDCTNSTTFAPTSSYKSTVDTLLNHLIANSSDNPTGFYSTSVIYNNTINDNINGYLLCRGDLNYSACLGCVESAVASLKYYCPAWGASQEGIIFLNKCMIRYVYNETLYGVLALEPEHSENAGYTPENKDDLRRLIQNTFRVLATDAANDHTVGRKYARTAVNFTALIRIYAMVQCTPDLSVGDCQSCLTYATGKFKVRAGENSLTPSCSVRYEFYPFFVGADSLPSGSADTTGISSRPNSGHGANSGGTSKWKAIIAAMVILGTVALVIFLYFLYRQYAWKTATNQEAKDKIKDLPLFKLKDLVIATDNFSESNMLGRGGFGPVYKGKFENGEEIAVKRLSKTSIQGLQEFMNEVVVISKLQHINLVRLLGCCVEGEEKLLVYEYMPNKSLDALLFDPSSRVHLDWKMRFNIIKGISRGLLYLHRDSRLRIIHRDLKASNILLDGNLNPKISDFGMAKIFGGNQHQGDTSRIVGTYGYMSPEYAMEGRFSEKSDVFSFGVLLLEIVSGTKNNNFEDEDSLSLLGHAWKLWNEDKIMSLVDPKISESTSYGELLKCIQLGLLCVQEFPEDRPSGSMVVSMIEGEVTDLPRPSQPGFTLRKHYSHNETHPNGHVYEYCSFGGVTNTSLSAR